MTQGPARTCKDPRTCKDLQGPARTCNDPRTCKDLQGPAMTQGPARTCKDLQDGLGGEAEDGRKTGTNSRKAEEEKNWEESEDRWMQRATTAAVQLLSQTAEVLLPIFTDESRQVTMETVKHNIDPHAVVVDSPLPELRLVLLGRKGAGKSSAGCTILDGIGGSEPRKTTEECVMRRADVWGRSVTVVDTPGWEWYYPLNSTSDWVRRETLRSATLCPPGPHALLLVVRSCASVTEAFLGQIAEHLQPLGEGVWDHTLVLFTRGDELNLASVEQRILSGGGRALRKLLEKCGNRYHVLDNRGKGDGRQVRELLRKTEEMAERGGHFGPDGAVLLGLRKDRDRTAEERRKKQRHVEEQMQREAIRASVSSKFLHFVHFHTWQEN
ncbi:GTPase IMAP family member 2 [Merluccius polli]|uniref:GTPase IMAP family member 2 n=1 Tax=Merluccius polli TaxID=89951 RepID=A0AA47NLB6_MERPO|nr:GTPase IMAP family member 2 [Merluccius polli]